MFAAQPAASRPAPAVKLLAPTATLRSPRPFLLAAAVAASGAGQQHRQATSLTGGGTSAEGLALRGAVRLNGGPKAVLTGNVGPVTRVGLGLARRKAAAEMAPIVGWIGTTCSLLLMSSPALTFQKVMKQRKVGGLDPAPYFVGLLSCMLWCSYAALSSKTFIFGSNVCGGCLQLLWCCLFIRYSRDKKQLAGNMAGIVGLWFVLTSLVVLVFKYLGFNPLGASHTIEIEAMGLICAALNVATYAAPMGGALQAIRTGSVENMPLPLSVMTLVASCCWFTYALLTQDIWCFVPNMCGVGLGLVQCLIYFKYSSGGAAAAGEQKQLPGSPTVLTGRGRVVRCTGGAAAK